MSNKELIERLCNPVTPTIYGQDVLTMREAAHALELADKRIAELEAERNDFHMGYRMKCDKETKELERRLAVAREALTNIYQQTQEGAIHALATEALIAIRQDALAQIGGDDAGT